MSNQRDDIFSLQGGRLNIGLSSIIGLTAVAGQNSLYLRFISGSSIEIGDASLTWGSGFLWDGLTPISMNAMGTIYFAATGATCVVTFLQGRTPNV